MLCWFLNYWSSNSNQNPKSAYVTFSSSCGSTVEIVCTAQKLHICCYRSFKTGKFLKYFLFSWSCGTNVNRLAETAARAKDCSDSKFNLHKQRRQGQKSYPQWQLLARWAFCVLKESFFGFFTSNNRIGVFAFNSFARSDVQKTFGGKLQGRPFWFFCQESCQGKRCANFSKFSRQKS